MFLKHQVLYTLSTVNACKRYVVPQLTPHPGFANQVICDVPYGSNSFWGICMNIYIYITVVIQYMPGNLCQLTGMLALLLLGNMLILYSK